MGDYIALAIGVAVLGAAIGYIVRAKKSGKKCIGCPHGDSCGKKDCGGSCCGGNKEQ